MARLHKTKYQSIKRFVLIISIVLFSEVLNAQNVHTIIHLRGVYDSKISLLPLTGPNALKPVLTVVGIKNGDTATLNFPPENLPGEFVLRFDYKEDPTSSPYPSEKRIIVNDQDLERKQSLRQNYFDEMDFSEALIVKTTNMKEWMDAYVNLYGELAKSVPMRDSLFTLAGKNAIEKAKKGDPVVYGWMVDYFFNGYESLNIQSGIQMLEPYLDDPKCLTTKRQEINRRLEGIKSLVKGSPAPDIVMQDSDNNPFMLSSYQGGKNNILILFWSADCVHCKETTDKLYRWYQDPLARHLLDIVAISLDETPPEIEKWKQHILEMDGWTHLRAEEGARSKAATDYYILSVPVMILVDAETRKIIGLPENTRQLNRLLGI